MNQALQSAKFLAAKPPIAMRLTKQRFREATEQGFQEMLAAGIRIQRDSFATSEPKSMMQEFLGKRTAKRED
jgi:enoyl-CoA hydratase/carnithine racemase